MAAKLVVTARKGGSRIALVGASGKELMTSVVFTEPRAKGATLRSLRGLLGEDIVVEDHTVSAVQNGKASLAQKKPAAVAADLPVVKAIRTKTAKAVKAVKA